MITASRTPKTAESLSRGDVVLTGQSRYTVVTGVRIHPRSRCVSVRLGFRWRSYDPGERVTVVARDRLASPYTAGNCRMGGDHEMYQHPSRVWVCRKCGFRL